MRTYDEYLDDDELELRLCRECGDELRPGEVGYCWPCQELEQRSAEWDEADYAEHEATREED